jgi:protein involved in polysaccharide export with SLBB domain
MFSSARKIVCGVALGLLCVSCAGSPEVGVTEDTVYEESAYQFFKHDYELGPGDVLEIVYHYTPKPETRVYRIAVGDVMRVEFAYHTEMDRTLTVRPDGNITIPRVGQVEVLGLTATEVQEKITDIFANEFKNPLITVTLTQYNRAIDYLKIAITTAPRGQSKLTTIRPDGWISFPVIEDLKAAGKTVPLLRKEVQEEYSKLIDHMTVTLILKVMKANLAYISGEVLHPNFYLMQGPTTVLQLISTAGGMLPTAERSQVLVISRNKEKRPLARLVDMEAELNEGNISRDIVLSQYDVVYVPKSSIARRGEWVELYINNIIPDAFDMTYNMGGQLIRHEPLVR